jgi:hypothetical protein
MNARSHWGAVRWLVACALAASFGGAARSARACSQAAPPPALSGYPEDGATNVPTDVVPFYDVNLSGMSDPPSGGQFVLRSAAGHEIGLSAAKPDAWRFQLTPEERLEPNTEYTLVTVLGNASAGNSTPTTVSFTTGTGVSAPPEPPTGVFLEHYRISAQSFGSCDPYPVGTCLAIPEGSVVLATPTWQGRLQEPGYLLREPWFLNLSGIDQGTPYECLSLQSRAPNGALSAPVSLCGSDAPLRELTSKDIACTSDGLSVRTQSSPVDSPDDSGSESGAGESASEGGCSVSVKATRASGSAALLFGFLLFGRLGLRPLRRRVR